MILSKLLQIIQVQKTVEEEAYQNYLTAGAIPDGQLIGFTSQHHDREV